MVIKNCAAAAAAFSTPRWIVKALCLRWWQKKVPMNLKLLHWNAESPAEFALFVYFFFLIWSLLSSDKNFEFCICSFSLSLLASLVIDWRSRAASALAKRRSACVCLAASINTQVVSSIWPSVDRRRKNAAELLFCLEMVSFSAFFLLTMQQLAAETAKICSANDRGDELCSIYNNRSLFMPENWMLPLCSLALTSKKRITRHDQSSRSLVQSLRRGWWFVSSSRWVRN